MQPNTRLLFSEAPTNPYLYVVDLEQIVAIARRHRLRTMIDSTFATPYNQNPLDFGIDLVGPARRGLAMGINEVAGYGAVSLAAVAAGYLAATYALRPQPFLLGVVFAARFSSAARSRLSASKRSRISSSLKSAGHP